MLGHVEPRDGDLVSHKEPNGNIVIRKVFARVTKGLLESYS